MMQIAAFDFYDTGDLLDYLLGQAQKGEALNSNFETLGFESLFILHNLGTLLFLFVYYPIAIAFTSLCAKFTYSRDVSEWGIERRRELLYGFFIGIVVESYSVLAVSCCINLRFLTWSSYGETIQSLATLSCLVLLVATPLFLLTFLRNRFESLQEREFRQKYGQFYKSLNLQQ